METDYEDEWSSFIEDRSKYEQIIGALTSEVNELSQHYEQLKIRCNAIEKKLSHKDEKVQSERRLLLMKERRLKAELAAVSKRRPVVDLTNSNVCTLLLERDYEKMASNLKATINWKELQKQEITGFLEKLNSNMERDKAIGSEISDKIDEYRVKISELESLIPQTDDSKLEIEVTNQLKEAKVEIRKVANALTDFLATNFPIPNPLDEVEVSSNFEYNPEKDYASMGDIIQSVLNAYISKPNDCYVDISEDWWLGHIEMLLRFEIIVRHKQDEQKVRLAFYDG